MLVLLPPSQGKATEGGEEAPAAPVDLRSLSLPALTRARREVLETLAAVSARPDALALLGAGERLRGEVERNTRWRSEPAVPVARLYSGVLYDAMDVPSLSPEARGRAEATVLVASAAYGALRLTDRVAPYRLSMGTSLPGLGRLAAWWRPALRAALDPVTDGHLLVDCRSTDYAAAWAPRGDAAGRTVAVRVLRERDGRRTVVSHMAKHTRGLVARACVEAPQPPTTPDELAEVVAKGLVETGADVELGAPARDGRRVLDVVTG